VPQSVVTFGQAGPKRDDPAWYAAYVLMRSSAAAGSRRLMKEIREKRGLAYGVSTQLVPYRHAGLIVGNVATENGRVAESIALVREEWRHMREEGPTAVELENAKTYLTGSFPLGLDSTQHIAGCARADAAGQARYQLSRPPRVPDRRRHAGRGARGRAEIVRSGRAQLCGRRRSGRCRADPPAPSAEVLTVNPIAARPVMRRIDTLLDGIEAVGKSRVAVAFIAEVPVAGVVRWLGHVAGRGDTGLLPRFGQPLADTTFSSASPSISRPWAIWRSLAAIVGDAQASACN